MFDLADGQLQEPPAHLSEPLGIAGRQEGVRALALRPVLDSLARERLGHLARRLLGGEDERDAAAEDPLEERPEDRVVRAAQDHGVDLGLAKRLGNLAHCFGGLIPERVVAFDQRHESRAGDRGHLHAGIDAPDQLGVAAAVHGCLGREQADAPVPGGERGRVRLGLEDADDRNREGALQVGKRSRGCGVARDDDELHASGLEEVPDLERETTNLGKRPGTVGQARVVAEVHDILGGKRDEELVEDGEAAHAGVEDTYRSRIHTGMIRTPFARRSRDRPVRVHISPLRFRAVVTNRIRALTLATAAALLLLVAAGAKAATKETVTITAADGTPLVATLYRPSGPVPAGGWPSVIFFHGLGGRRADMEKVAEQMGIAGEHYVVLAPDARGHGDSGGLVGIDGPNEIADVRTLYNWLRDRPDTTDDKIGAWGISYGGGAAWNSLAAGVPWATIEVVETWTDLASALAPQGLVKSGVVAGFLGEIPPNRMDPEVNGKLSAALAGQLTSVLPWLSARSSLASLAGVTTPVFMMQGRRDFAFGIDQAERAWAQLKGPKRLWFGLHGHAPSTFPAADSGVMLTEAAKWFDTYLRGEPGGFDQSKPVAVSPERWQGTPVRYSGLPKRVAARFALPGNAAIGAAGKVTRSTARLAAFTETFGTPTVKVTATASGGWTRLIAVLSARTPAGKEIVVAGGGVPVTQGKGTYTIALSSQATGIPRGSRLTVTFASSSLAQNPANLLYLDLPFATGARVTVGGATLRLPVLAKPVSK